MEQSTDSIIGDDTGGASDGLIRELGVQAALYEVAYLNCFLWPLILLTFFAMFPDEELVQMRYDPGIYTLNVLYVLLFPTQVRRNGTQFVASLLGRADNHWYFSNVF